MYKINRENGKIVSISTEKMSIPIDTSNRHYKEFLEWNSQQSIPLDLNDQIPVKSQVELDREQNLELIKFLKNKENWNKTEIESLLRAFINLNF